MQDNSNIHSQPVKGSDNVRYSNGVAKVTLKPYDRDGAEQIRRSLPHARHYIAKPTIDVETSQDGPE